MAEMVVRVVKVGDIRVKRREMLENGGIVFVVNEGGCKSTVLSFFLWSGETDCQLAKKNLKLQVSNLVGTHLWLSSDDDAMCETSCVPHTTYN